MGPQAFRVARLAFRTTSTRVFAADGTEQVVYWVDAACWMHLD